MTGKSIFAMVLAAAGAMPTDSAADLLTDLRTCHAETEDAKRLACYDRLSRAKPEPPAAPVVAAVAPPAPSAGETGTQPQTQEEKFGYNDLRARQEREMERADPDRLEALVAKVTEATRQPNGTYVVTLDNGQVWRQTSVEDFYRLAVGDEVRIKSAAMGTFLLANPNGRTARVRRVE